MNEEVMDSNLGRFFLIYVSSNCTHPTFYIKILCNKTYLRMMTYLHFNIYIKLI